MSAAMDYTGAQVWIFVIEECMMNLDILCQNFGVILLQKGEIADAGEQIV